MKHLCLFFLTFCLTSCASSYSKYSARLFAPGSGYSDYRIDEDMFCISFQGNEHTNSGTVMDYALKRAAELTLENGYKYFFVLQERNDTKERLASSMSGSGSTTFIHTYKEVFPGVTIRIICYKNNPPDGAIDAEIYTLENSL